MPNLKPVYDAALVADAEVKRILNEMDAAFADGSEEGKQKALELRPALDEARAKSEEANQLYISMRDAARANDEAASLFVPPSDPAQNDPKAEDKKVMKRDEFDALEPAARMKFVQSGGKVED